MHLPNEHFPEPLANALHDIWILVVALILMVVHALVSNVIGTLLRAWSVRVAIRVALFWVDSYCALLGRDDRRADFRMDLFWQQYRRGRRRDYSDFRLAWYVLQPVVSVAHHDVHEVAKAFSQRLYLWLARVGRR